MKTLEETINQLCEELPLGMVVNLSMENGAAWVTLVDGRGNRAMLPDSTDKTLVEQLEDALWIAKSAASLRKYIEEHDHQKTVDGGEVGVL